MADRARLNRSRLLQTPKFAGLADQFIPQDAVVVDAVDTDVEVFDGTRMKPHPGMAVVLTAAQLLAFRGRGVFGARAPFVVNVNSIGRAGVTRQGNVDVEFRGEQGFSGLWKLLFGDMSLADGWMRQIWDQARQPQAEDRSSGPSAEWKACRVRLQSFCDAMSPFTGPAMVGQPLAEGLGLERVIDLITRHFLSPADVRQADTIISMDLITETGRGLMTPNDLAAVMGLTPEAMRKTGLSGPQLRLAGDLAEAAQVFLRQFDEDGSEIWELWKKRDDVAAEFLSWHTVARLRLATIGVLEAIEPV